MEKFKKRLKKVGHEWLIAICFVIVMFIVVGVVAGVLILLPIWLLSFVIGELAYYWLYVSLIGMLIYTQWNSIVGKFKWLFVEPFQKENK